MAGRLLYLLSKNQKRSCAYWFFCLVSLLPIYSVAQSTTDQSSAGKQKIADVRVVIDVSGSMKQNDPNNLRQPALELLVKLLPEQSKAGVWTFGKYINMLVPHSDVNGDWRKQALAKGKEINSTGLFTNIGEALEKAAYDAKYPNEKYRTSIILLTDGMVDIDREPEVNKKEWRRVVDDVLPTIKQAGYTIHTIALSDNADTELLNKLAVGTDGIAAIANSADELMKIFLAAFDNAAPAEQVPLKGNTFAVDSSVEEFTALIFTKPGSAPTHLLSPDGKEYTFADEDPYISWYRSDKYDLITVSKPLEGEWQALADIDPDSRITVVSNLNLVVKPLKNNLYNQEEQELSLLLSENDKTITRSNFLELLDINYQVERLSDSEQWQGSLSQGKPPANGVYTTKLDMFAEEGNYRLTALVDGKSFSREFSHTFSVRQPFSVSHDKSITNGKTSYQIQVSYYGDDLNRTETKVTALVRDPSRLSSVKGLSLTESDNWILDFLPEDEGTYEVAITIHAVSTTGKKFEVTPDSFAINTESDSPFNETFDTEPEPEPVTEQVPSLDLPVQAPDVLAETEPEPVAEVINEDESEDEAEMLPPAQEVQSPEPSSSKLILYAGLILGNVVILVLAYMAYRMIMGNKRDKELEELEQAVAELDEKPAAKKASAPTMADMDNSEGEMNLMSDDLNIADDGEDDAEADSKQPLGDEPAMHQADDSETDGNLGVSDVEFSLDDFSSEDLDDDK